MAETPSDSLSPTVSREAFVAELRRLLPEDALIHDEAELRAYECDGLSAFRELPWAVALPRSEEEAVALLQTCHRLRVPVVPRGAGTGLSGGALPHPELERF